MLLIVAQELAIVAIIFLDFKFQLCSCWLVSVTHCRMKLASYLVMATCMLSDDYQISYNI